jgi:hypothetical protein
VTAADGEEPTATFVPSWDEADDGADEAEEGPADRDGAGSDDEARWASAADDLHRDGAGDLDADPAAEHDRRWADGDGADGGGDELRPAPEVTAELVAPLAVGAPHVATTRPVEPEPAQPVEPEPAQPDEPDKPEPAPDATDPGALRPGAPGPGVRAARPSAARRPAPARPSMGRRLVGKLRAAVGLILLIVLAGVGLAAAIGLTVAGLAFVLRQTVAG